MPLQGVIIREVQMLLAELVVSSGHPAAVASKRVDSELAAPGFYGFR